MLVKDHGIKLQQGRFRQEVRKNFFLKRVLKHWSRLPKRVPGSSSLEVFKRCIEIALRDIIKWWDSTLRLDWTWWLDLMILVVFPTILILWFYVPLGQHGLGKHRDGCYEQRIYKGKFKKQNKQNSSNNSKVTLRMKNCKLMSGGKVS